MRMQPCVMPQESLAPVLAVTVGFERLPATRSKAHLRKTKRRGESRLQRRIHLCGRRSVALLFQVQDAGFESCQVASKHRFVDLDSEHPLVVGLRAAVESVQKPVSTSRSASRMSATSPFVAGTLRSFSMGASFRILRQATSRCLTSHRNSRDR